jgi:hypothetical protein
VTIDIVHEVGDPAIVYGPPTSRELAREKVVDIGEFKEARKREWAEGLEKDGGYTA